MDWTQEQLQQASLIFEAYANTDGKILGGEIALLFFFQKLHWSYERTRIIVADQWLSLDEELEQLLAQVERTPESPRDPPSDIPFCMITPLELLQEMSWGRAEIEAFRKTFAACDLQENNTISQGSLMQAFMMTGLPYEKHDVDARLHILGTTEDEHLEFFDFIVLIGMSMKHIQKKAYQESKQAIILNEVEVQAAYAFEMHQLLVAFNSFRKLLSSCVDGAQEIPKKNALEAMMDCFQKVISANAGNKIQMKLQTFILDFVQGKSEPKFTPISMVDTDYTERWKWWCEYHCWEQRAAQFEDRKCASKRLPKSSSMTDLNVPNGSPNSTVASRKSFQSDDDSDSSDDTQARYKTEEFLKERQRKFDGKLHKNLSLLSLKPQLPRSSQQRQSVLNGWQAHIARQEEAQSARQRAMNRLIVMNPNSDVTRFRTSAMYDLYKFPGSKPNAEKKVETLRRPGPRHSCPWFENDPQFSTPVRSDSHAKCRALHSSETLSDSAPLKHKPDPASSKSASSRHNRCIRSREAQHKKMQIQEATYGMGSQSGAPAFKRAVELRTIPHFAPRNLDYSYYQMNDTVFDVSSTVAKDTTTIDLSHNQISNLKPILPYPWIAACRVLKLDGLKLVECPFSLLATKCPNLVSLSLDHTPFHQNWFQELAAAFRTWHALELLSLVHTGLGCNGQRDCVTLFEALQRCSLLELDISGNVIHESSFLSLREIVGEKSQLRQFFMNDNAGGLNGESGIGVVFEVMARNASLKRIGVSNSNVRATDAFIFETMLLSRGEILDEVDFTNNPFGVSGLEYILRMATGGLISTLRAESFRECEEVVITYNVRSPAAEYHLDMSTVLGRAQMKRLLLWAAKFNMPANDLFANLHLNGASAQVSSLYKVDPIEKFVVPASGKLQFHFTGTVPVVGDGNQDAMKKWHVARRQKVSLEGFVVLASLYKGLRVDKEKIMFLSAVASSLLLKISHLKFFLEKSPRYLWDEILTVLFPAMDIMDQLSGDDVFSNVNPTTRFTIQKALSFNERNPTGRYHLDLSSPPEFTTLERILLINLFEKNVAMKLNRTDCSQLGNYNGIRNFSMDGTEIREDFAVWKIPHAQCSIRLDYVSPIRPKMSAPITPMSTFRRLLAVMKSTNLRDIDKIAGLRTISDALVLDVALVQYVMLLFPQPISRNKRGSVRASNIADVESDNLVRMEAIIVLFGRVADRLALCCPGGCVFDECPCLTDERYLGVLYNSRMFLRSDMRSLVSRLGVLNMFDAIHCCQRSASNTGCEWQGAMQRNRVECDLRVYEYRRLVQYLVKLAVKEQCESLRDVVYSENRFQSGLDIEYFSVPSAWLDEIPHIGTISISFVTERSEHVRASKRYELACEIFSIKDF